MYEKEYITKKHIQHDLTYIRYLYLENSVEKYLMAEIDIHKVFSSDKADEITYSLILLLY